MNPFIRGCAMAFAALAFSVPANGESIQAAGSFDPRLTLIRTSTHFVVLFQRYANEGRDPEAIFIEDVIVPSMLSLAKPPEALSYKEFRGLLEFVLANERSASEEVSEIAYTLYRRGPDRYCKAISEFPAGMRKQLFRRAADGYAELGPPSAPLPVSCK